MFHKEKKIPLGNILLYLEWVNLISLLLFLISNRLEIERNKKFEGKRRKDRVICEFPLILISNRSHWNEEQIEYVVDYPICLLTNSIRTRTNTCSPILSRPELIRLKLFQAIYSEVDVERKLTKQPAIEREPQKNKFVSIPLIYFSQLQYWKASHLDLVHTNLCKHIHTSYARDLYPDLPSTISDKICVI